MPNSTSIESYGGREIYKSLKIIVRHVVKKRIDETVIGILYVVKIVLIHIKNLFGEFVSDWIV